MKILHVITTINRGGAENYLADLTVAQVKNGHKVMIAYLKGDGYWAGFLEGNGISVQYLKMKYHGDLIPLLKLGKIIITWKPDIIHAHMPPAEMYASIVKLCICRKKTLIISKHNIERFCTGVLNNHLFNFTNSVSDKYIAISNAVEAYLKSLKVKEKKIKTIYYGIDTSRFTIERNDNLRADWGISKETLLFGTVCRLMPQKAVDQLLKGYAAFRDENKVDTKLCIVGSGAIEGELKKLAVELKISPYIVWAGQRADIPEIMQSFDLFLLSSIYEGFGLVLIEAMASSLPVIATNVCSIPEIVSNDKTGILVEPNNPAEIATAMKRLLNKDLRKQFGDNGFKRVQDIFSIKKMVDLTEEVYSQVFTCVE